MVDLQTESRGNQADYLLGTTEGWGAVDVVRWHAVEEISQPFRYEIALVRRANLGPLDLDALVDTGATFAIATEQRWRLVHGVLSEAAEIDQTPALFVYRVLLVPHLWRARYRRRCRTFVDKSLTEIVEHILENRAHAHPHGLRGLERLVDVEAGAAGDGQPGEREPALDRPRGAFEEPRGKYRWAMSDPERVQQRRPFVVQYNEPDFDFVSRLLEAEGLSYFFEHTAGSAVMTLTDRPGHAPLFERDETHRLRGLARAGASRDQEVIRTLGATRRMRSKSVTMRDFAWRKSSMVLEATASVDAELTPELGHFEFPARDEDEPRQPGAAPARALMERFRAESALSDGTGTLRTLEPGRRFELRDDDGLRDGADLVTVRVETFAAELFPEGTALDHERFGFDAGAIPRAALFESRFQVLPADVAFRPARSTPKPRVAGVQRAVVTTRDGAEKGPPELNNDEWGRVQVRFRWDERRFDGTPSSKYIRCSQYWAGAGFGSVHVPRVGQEVLVAFEDGDPDRPIIVGRVYNRDNPPPLMEPDTTISTIRSDSVGGDGAPASGYNELRFDDRAAHELVFLHAQRDLEEIGERNHSTSVGGDQSNSVGGNQSSSVGNDRTHGVDGTESVTVGGDRTTLFESNEKHTVGAFRQTYIGANDDLFVTGWRNVRVGVGQNVYVGGPHQQRCVDYVSFASATHAFESPSFLVKAPFTKFDDSQEFLVEAAGCVLSMTSGCLVLSNGCGATVALMGGCVVVIGGTVMVNSGGPTALAAGGTLSAAAPTIKLNG